MKINKNSLQAKSKICLVKKEFLQTLFFKIILETALK